MVGSLLAAEPIHGSVLEPCCGDHAIVRALASAHRVVRTNEHQLDAPRGPPSRCARPGELGVTAEADVAYALNLITAQGKDASFRISDMAAQGERLFAAFARFGAVGPEAVRQLGAITQVARQATGGPEQAATAVEALVRALTDAATIDAIETTLSVRVRRDDGLFRDLDQVLAEIATATGGDPVVLSKIFDAEAIRVIGQAASAQGRADYQRYLGVEPAGNELAADAATMAATIAAQGQDVKTAIDARLYDWLTGPLGTVAQTIAAYKEELFSDHRPRTSSGGWW